MRYGGWGIHAKLRILAETGLYMDGDGRPSLGLVQQRAQKSLTKIWSRKESSLLVPCSVYIHKMASTIPSFLSREGKVKNCLFLETFFFLDMRNALPEAPTPLLSYFNS